MLRFTPRGDRLVDVAGIAEDGRCALWWSLPSVLDRGEVQHGGATGPGRPAVGVPTPPPAAPARSPVPPVRDPCAPGPCGQWRGMDSDSVKVLPEGECTSRR
ncbi:hypothetical protein GCM10009528_31250 [Kineococcus aurantiacus]